MPNSDINTAVKYPLNALAGKNIIAIVVSRAGNLQRTGLFVSNNAGIYTYMADMSGESVCQVYQTGFVPHEQSFDVIADFIMKNCRYGMCCTVSVGGVDKPEDIIIQTNCVLGECEGEMPYVHVRYDFNVQVKAEILKRLTEAPSDCFCLDIPRSCAVITGPIPAFDWADAKQDAMHPDAVVRRHAVGLMGC